MPQIPYAPVPDVAPSDQTAYSPHVFVRTSPDMFGANIGAAVEHLGGTISHVGDEMFNRALALQEMKNQTEASEAVAKASQLMGQEQVRFNTLEGKNANSEAYEQFQKNIDGIRTGILPTLSNPAVQRMFNNEIRSQQVRENIYGASHAARQNKVWVDQTQDAIIDQAEQDAYRNYSDPKAFQDNRDKVREAIGVKGAIKGWDTTETADQASRADSRVVTAANRGLLKDDPIKGKQFYEDNKGNLHWTDDARLKGEVDTAFRNAITRQSTGDFAPYLTNTERDKLRSVQVPMQAIVRKAMEDNPNLRIHVESGYRSYEQQAEIYQRSGQGRLFAAAPPGRSNHQWGGAVDLTPGEGTSYADIQKAIYKASDDLGVPLSDEHARLGARDRGHYSIPRDTDLSGWKPPASMPVDQRAAWNRKYVEAMLPNDPIVGDMAEQRTATQNALQKRLLDQQETSDRDLLTARIMDKGDGTPSTNPEELLADPKAEEAWTRLGQSPGGPAKQMEIFRGINSWQNATQQKTDPEYLTYLKGRFADDPQGALEETKNIITDKSMPLSQTSRRMVIGWRTAASKQSADKDPKVSRALTFLQTKINDPNFHMSKLAGASEEDKRNYYTFVGALQSILEEPQYAQKQPSPKEIQDIGNALLYNMAVTKQRATLSPMRIFRGPTYQENEPLYQKGFTQTPEQRDEVRQDLIKRNPNYSPTERDIDIEAARRAYEALQKKPEKPATFNERFGQ